MKGKIPTLQDVAKEAGVSAMTVSRVVNDHPRISPETATKVKEVIERLGYTTAPSARKRGRRSRANQGIHTGHIAVVTLGLTGSALKIPLFATTLLGVQNALQEADLSMLVTPVGDLSRLPGLLDRRSVDGIIVTGHAPQADLKKLFKNLPAVYAYNILNDPNETLDVDRVVPNNEAIGEIAAEYLTKQECKSAVFLDPSPSHPEFKVRGEAFKAKFEGSGRKVTSIIHGEGKSDDHISDPDMKEGVLEKQIDELLKLKDVDSLFIPSDRLTARVYAFLREKGVSPSNYKIISCNNEEPFLEGLYPHPATIEIGAEKIGEAAVAQLIKRLASKELASEVVKIQPELIEDPRL
ncbi:MAG: LacI family transcriptional regulator [Lentisphaeraceae bacterium]|nr:LacI family transcriptional regulator [Lentisphaeraceae bacterium]